MNTTGGLIDVLGHVSSVPLEAPLNLGVLLENSTTIRVTWAAVDKETVRGHLLGYKVPPMLYLLMNDGCSGRSTVATFKAAL